MPTRGELEHGRPELKGFSIEQQGSRQEDNKNIATSEKVATALIHQRPKHHLQDANTVVRMTPPKKILLGGTLQGQK